MGRRRKASATDDKKKAAAAAVVGRKKRAAPPTEDARGAARKRSRRLASGMQNGGAGPDPSTPSESPEVQPPPSSSDGNANKRKATRRKRRRRDASVPEDAVARIRRQVRYFFLRMDQERNLLDAYSNEGWKGQSREKVRPEKELLRAQAEIRKCKLRVREAMKELDGILLEGSIVESAFDDDGRLDYHEIFCAICHSHDTEADNDIILCDGACNRGFHQRCLTPPLATEDIPPGDDGWLCPACECKEDCVELINDKLGTNYEIENNWETFFPEAVSGSEENEAAKDMASDESDDDDYDPSSKPKEPTEAAADTEEPANSGEGKAEAEDEDEDEEGESESEADDDDEDDLSEEDLDQFLKDAKEQEENGDREEGDKEGAENRSEEGADGEAEVEAEIVSGKRRRRDVDYRKLHDEMFGWFQDLDVDAFLSEDEDWGPLNEGRRSSGNGSKAAAASAASGSGGDDDDEFTTTKTVRCDKSKRIPQEAVERLREAFSGNQLPSRSFKEDISKELGLSYRKVDVWFKNERCHALRKGLVQPTRPCPWKLKQQRLDNVMLRQLGEVELQLHDLRKVMEAVRQPHVLKISARIRGFENSVIDVNRGKRVIYKPVAQVVEKRKVVPN